MYFGEIYSSDVFAFVSFSHWILIKYFFNAIKIFLWKFFCGMLKVVISPSFPIDQPHTNLPIARSHSWRESTVLFARSTKSIEHSKRAYLARRWVRFRFRRTSMHPRTYAYIYICITLLHVPYSRIITRMVTKPVCSRLNNLVLIIITLIIRYRILKKHLLIPLYLETDFIAELILRLKKFIEIAWLK